MLNGNRLSLISPHLQVECNHYDAGPKHPPNFWSINKCDKAGIAWWCLWAIWRLETQNAPVLGTMLNLKITSTVPIWGKFHRCLLWQISQMLSYPKCKKTVYNYPEVLCFRLTASKEKPRREDTQLLVVQDSFSPLKRNYKPSQILGSLLLYWCDKAPKFSTEISNMQWKTQWHFSGVLGFDGPGGLAQNEFCLGISTHHTLPKIHTHNSIKKLVGDAISPSIQKNIMFIKTGLNLLQIKNPWSFTRLFSAFFRKLPSCYHCHFCFIQRSGRGGRVGLGLVNTEKRPVNILLPLWALLSLLSVLLLLVVGFAWLDTFIVALFGRPSRFALDLLHWQGRWI